MKQQNSLALATMIVLFCVKITSADFMLYDNRNDFDAAVGSTVVEDFNSFVNETPFHTTPLALPDFTLSMTGNPRTNQNNIKLPPNQSGTFGIDGTNVADVFLNSSSSLFLTFDRAIMAIGFDVRHFGVGSISPMVIDGTLFNLPDDRNQFIGVVSDTAFLSVEFRGLRNDNFMMDNVTYEFRGTQAIPEPSGLALVMLSLGWAVTRRKRAGKQTHLLTRPCTS